MAQLWRTGLPFNKEMLVQLIEDLDIENVEIGEQFIKDFAIDIIGDVAGGHIEDAHGKTASLLNEEKVALWSILDSKTRSALKKYAEELDFENAIACRDRLRRIQVEMEKKNAR